METANHAKQTKRAAKTTKAGVRPRELAHRGVVDAAGLLFSLSTTDEMEAKRRILRLWVAGATVLRISDSRNAARAETLLLKLPKPLRVSCSCSPGMPLVPQHGLLTALPLSEGEAARLNALSNSVVVAQGGTASVLAVENATVEDPADWLDTSAWEWTRADSLGLPPLPIRDIAATSEFDARARLAKVTGEDPARRSAIEALRQAMQGKRGGNGENTTGAGQSGTKGSGIGAGGASPLGSLLNRLFGQKGGALGLGPAAEEQGRNSLLDAANRLAARFAMLTGLSKLIGRHQAEYMRRMMDMFERGDFEQALRHAIGFSDLEGTDAPPALRTPTPRADLTISPQSTPASGSIGLPTEWTEHLRKLYRQAFERLEGAGRIEEAAFVLAELLSAHEEAVGFLEKHKLFKLAAEIAEARNLPPGLVVRQWFLAGETARAVHIARRTGAFADAVLRLERSDDKRSAAQLRWLWAQSLAEAGSYYQAFGVVKPALDNLRQQAGRWAEILEWLDKSAALGGTVGAEALACQFCLLTGMDYNAPDPVREQALTLLESEDEENAPARVAFARELTNGANLPAIQTLARAAVRACLRDVGLDFNANLNAADYARLLQFADDAALRADAPPLPKPTPAPATLAPVGFQFPVEAAGTLSITDAAFLPDGRCLAALGEMGVRLLTRDGRTVRHWDTPAHQLAVSDAGNRVLVLSRRGDLWRIARLDLTTRKLEEWGGAKLDTFAPDYDGSLWFVAMDKDFLALDATAETPAALWRLPNLEGRIRAIARSPQQCSFLLFAAGATDEWGKPVPLWTRLEKWTHSLPDLMLRERAEVKQLPEPPRRAMNMGAKGKSVSAGAQASPPAQPGDSFQQSIAAGGDVYQWQVEEVETLSGDPSAPPASANNSAWLTTLLRPSLPNSASAPTTFYSEQVMGDYAIPLPPLAGEKWLWVAIRLPDGIEGRLLTRPQGVLKAKFQLRDSSQASARFTPTHLTVADDKGRLLVLELDTLKLVRDLRLS